MVDTIRSDLFRWYGKDKLSIIEKIRAQMIPQIKIMLVKRRVEQYRDRNSVLFLAYSWKYRRLKIRYGVDIPARVKLGNGIMIEHIGGITINPEVVIGNNCNIYNGVTIGVEKRGKREGTPIIGNRVWIGANSVVVGNVSIGDNVLIAPGAFVNFDVPENSIVLGNPGKIIRNIRATDKYIINTVQEFIQ